MKVTIDLDKLLEEGRIDQAEYDKFNDFASHATAGLAFNIMLGFGVIAVSGAALALVPSEYTAILLGLLICGGGFMLTGTRRVSGGIDAQWLVLENLCVLIGALMVGGGMVKLGHGSVDAFLTVAGLFVAVGVYARSSLLIVLAVLALSSCLGVRTGYLKATYFLGVEEPSLTVIYFSMLAVAAYYLSLRLAAAYQALAIAASRASVFLVNLGFWIGSIWGDETFSGGHVPEELFAAFWMLALVAAGAWAWLNNRRWLVNLAAVFGGIHLFTQAISRLGASPGSILASGVLFLVFAIGIRSLNAEMKGKA